MYTHPREPTCHRGPDASAILRILRDYQCIATPQHFCTHAVQACWLPSNAREGQLLPPACLQRGCPHPPPALRTPVSLSAWPDAFACCTGTLWTQAAYLSVDKEVKDFCVPVEL